MIEAEIFKALGDPIRLEIIKRLSSASPCTISTLSKNLGVTRQGARKQLAVLEASSLVQLTPLGRETHVVLNASRLQIAKRFITEMENQWGQRLEALKTFTENQDKGWY